MTAIFTINVVLKNGALIPVPNADAAEWISEREYGGPQPAVGGHTVRLVCKSGANVLAKFNADDVSGYVWRDGNGPMGM